MVRYFAKIGYNQDATLRWLSSSSQDEQQQQPERGRPVVEERPWLVRAVQHVYDARLEDAMGQGLHLQTPEELETLATAVKDSKVRSGGGLTD